MNREIIIIPPISDCPRTGLPRVARFENLNISRNGSIMLSYTEDTLDNSGEVFVRGQEMKQVRYLPYAENTPEGPVETPFLPEHEALVESVTPAAYDLLATVNTLTEESEVSDE